MRAGLHWCVLVLACFVISINSDEVGNAVEFLSQDDVNIEWYRPASRTKREPQRRKPKPTPEPVIDDDTVADDADVPKRGAGKNNGEHDNKPNRRCRGLEGFRCATGPNCIPLNKLCNGKPDCPDASDETYKECKDKKCPNMFKCPYGACVNKNARCNGVKDCHGGADEVGCKSKPKPKPEHVVCAANEYKCKSGECIKRKFLCNGKPNCKDKSDETEQLCNAKTCTDIQFKCQYGACIAADQVCDGFRDCVDRSDETEAACQQYQPDLDTRGGEDIQGCMLPAKPDNGNYTINGQGQTGGQHVPSNTVLFFSCKSGYQIRPVTSAILYCDAQFLWNTEPPKCVVECPRLISSSMDIVYSRNGLVIDQTEALLPNTVATLKCKHSYRPPSADPNYRDLACQDTGFWNRPLFSCTPICGTEIPDGQPLIINGEDVKSGEFPWNVGIYRSPIDPVDYQHICGGTIISPRIILSAAHCFYDESTQKVFNHKYAIGAGKYYRFWKTNPGQDPYAQLKEVLNENIRLPNEYHGSRTSYRSDVALLILDVSDSLSMSDLVRPICIDWDQASENEALKAGSYGKVAGWGKTEEDGLQSETLKLLTLPFIPTFPDCFNSVPESFQPYLQEDKICAGYLNGSSVCEGDSGGGLVFKNPTTKLWFLRAIVSIDPIKGNNCDSHSYTGFTRLSYHLQWVRSLFALIA